MLLTNKDIIFINKNYPWLTIYWDDLVRWFIKFSANYNFRTKKLILNEIWENFLEWKYEIKIILDKQKFPQVYELNWDLKRWIEFHIYFDWKFCLINKLFEEKLKNNNLQFILEELIIPFLYNQEYKKTYWNFLWEYWHGIEWTFEYIAENNISTEDYLITLKEIKSFINKNLKLFTFSEFERKRLITILNLKSKKSKSGLKKFSLYFKRHTNLFTKI